MIPPTGIWNELPLATEMGAPIQVPHIQRSGVPPWSQSSTPLIVQPPEEFVQVIMFVLLLVGSPLTMAALLNVQAVPPVV